MSSSAKKITQTFNGRAEWNVGGGAFFKLLASVNPVDVELYNSGRQVLLAAQVDSGFYQRIAFDRIVVTTGALEPVSFLVAPDDGGSDTFSGVVSGTIDVTDRGARILGRLALTAAGAPVGKDLIVANGNAYVAYALFAAVAGQFSYTHLFNAGALTLYLDKLFGDSSTATPINVAHTTATVGAAYGTLPQNKSLGGAAATAQTLVGSNAGALGTVFERAQGSASGRGEVTFDPPILIPPGRGVIVQNAIVNIVNSTSLQWREY